jgi:hypothetical protein
MTPKPICGPTPYSTVAGMFGRSAVAREPESSDGPAIKMNPLVARLGAAFRF